jgi:hypothetical protein
LEPTSPSRAKQIIENIFNIIISRQICLSINGYVQERRMTMVKRIIVIGLLSLVVAFNSYAQDSDRIDQLEKEVLELKLRILKLESLLIKSGAAQEVVTPGGGWKSIANWRKLTTDMDYSDVRKILGEPQRIDGGDLAVWYYQNGGEVRFILGRVNGWTEPRE